MYHLVSTPIKSIMPLCQHQIHQRVTNGTALAHDFVKKTNLYLNQLILIISHSMRQIIVRIIEDRCLEYLSCRCKSHPWGAMGMVGTSRSCCEVSLSDLTLTVPSFSFSFPFSSHSISPFLSLGQPDTDSDHDIYRQHLGPSVELLNSVCSSAPTLGDFGNGHEPYPAWGAEHTILLSKEEIEDIFLNLLQKFGFQ